MEMNDSLIEKITSGGRISGEDALALYEAEMDTLGELATAVKHRFNPEHRATFLIDRNINYTNVCHTDCTFCGFYRHDSSHPEAYVNSKEVLGEKIREALELGATRILMQGGHNDDLSYEYYTDLISWIRKDFDIEINAFSPSEVYQMHRMSGKSYREILSELKGCGLTGLPGGGAELLDDANRKKFSPKKISSDLWIEIMEVAHDLALTTTATMVIGFGESLKQRLGHLERLRALQDRSHKKENEGFNAFISWVLQFNENTSVGRSRLSSGYGTDAEDYLRNMAVSRIYLDNIPHHSSSWVTMGPEIAQKGLFYGCDDYGSTMMEENVVSQAGALTATKWSMSPEELCGQIRDAGFIPAQRNTSYEVLRTFDEDTETIESQKISAH